MTDQRLRLGCSASRRTLRPVKRRFVIGLGRLIFGKEARDRTAGGKLGRHAPSLEDGKQELRLDVPVPRGPLQPTHGLETALRDCAAFEIAASDPVLRLDRVATRGAGQVPE